jgi:hypothetical protein
MHKYILFVIFFGLLKFESLAQCAKGISTNPDNPVNTERPDKRNTFFDWRLLTFSVNSQYISSPQISSPFNQSDNLMVNHFLNNQDRLPQDGWELIKYDFGFNENGTPKTTPVGYIYLVLYNKFTGVLRVFVAGDRPQAFNGASMQIKFISGKMTNALSNPSKIYALDKFENTPSISAVSEYNNNNAKWFYADFQIGYDPCTCIYESSLVVQIRLINKSIIQLAGTLDGKLTNIDNGSGTVSENGFSFNPSNLATIAAKAQKSYTDISKFTDEQLKALKVEGKTDIELTIEQLFKKKSLTDFQQEIKKSSFLQDGLKALPYIGAAVSLVDFFVGGGKESPQEVKIMPMALNATIDLKGSLEATYLYGDITFYTPGSSNAQIKNPIDYPYYNEVLGTFNLLTTPKINYSLYDSYPITFATGNMLEDIEYVLNPAAGFDPLKTEIMGNIIFRNSDKSIRAETGYYPINALKQIIFITYPFNPELRLLVKLVRLNSTANTQSVLFAATYPMTIVYCPSCLTGTFVNLYNINNNVEISDTKSNYVVSVPPQNTIVVKSGGSILPTSSLTVSGNFYNNYSSYLPQVSSARINDFCNSSIYLNSSRNLRVATEPIDQSRGQTQIETALSVFPNPTTGKVSFHYYVEEPSQVRLNLISTTGTVVATPVDAYQEAGSYEFAYDASNLPAGVYISTLETNKGKETKRLVVIK